MLVLGIESSCDETALALVDDNGVRASVISSQADIHALFGGVVPELASREHARLIGPLLDSLLRQADLGSDPWKAIDRIAVTRGPGLMGSLLVGVAFAKSLAMAHDIPLIGIDHLQGHLLAAELENDITWPALGVLISGGHTHLYRMDGPVDMTVLGKTIDDAAGEACDKFAKAAGLPYPGGALLDALGKRERPIRTSFPVPTRTTTTWTSASAGSKPPVLSRLSQHPEARFPGGDTPARERLRSRQAGNCATPRHPDLLAIAETLVIKATRAMQLFRPKSIVVALEVWPPTARFAANLQSLRKNDTFLSSFPDFRCAATTPS